MINNDLFVVRNSWMEGLNHVRNLLKQKIGGMDDIIDKILDEIVAVLSPQDSSYFLFDLE